MTIESLSDLKHLALQMAIDAGERGEQHQKTIDRARAFEEFLTGGTEAPIGGGVRLSGLNVAHQ